MTWPRLLRQGEAGFGSHAAVRARACQDGASRLGPRGRWQPIFWGFKGGGRGAAGAATAGKAPAWAPTQGQGGCCVGRCAVAHGARSGGVGAGGGRAAGGGGGGRGAAGAATAGKARARAPERHHQRQKGGRASAGRCPCPAARPRANGSNDNCRLQQTAERAQGFPVVFSISPGFRWLCPLALSPRPLRWPPPTAPLPPPVAPFLHRLLAQPSQRPSRPRHSAAKNSHAAATQPCCPLAIACLTFGAMTKSVRGQLTPGQQTPNSRTRGLGGHLAAPRGGRRSWRPPRTEKGVPCARP